MKKPSDSTGKIAKSAGLVGIAVMCSRVLGLVREQVMATLFGAGMAYDSFVVAFRIPNLLRDLFGEGALSAAFVAVFSDYDTNKGKKATWQLANNVLSAIAILVSLITLLGIVFAGPLVTLIAPDFALITGKAELTRKLTVIMFPFLVFVSIAAVVMGILNSKGRFFVPSISSSFFNLGSIVGGVSLAIILPKFGYPAIVGMAIGTLIGGFLQMSGQFPTLLKTGFRFKPQVDLRDPGLRRVFMLMIPAIIGLGATQINIFVNTNFASSCVEGSVSWLNYAFRLVQFPIGVFGVAVSIATMPVISRYAAQKNFTGIRETYVSALTMAFCLTIPATAGLFLLSEMIVKIIFEHGQFSMFDTVRTAEALRFYVLGLFAYASVKITVPVFYALNDTKFPVVASFLAVGTNILIILLTIDGMQHKAIALSTSCAMFGNFVLLSVVLYRKLSGYSLSYLVKGFLKVVFATGVMWVWLRFFKDLMAQSERGFFTEIGGLIFLVCSGAGVYGGVLYLTRLPELTTLVAKVVGRVRP
nr:murein biosynthesis integral membrane protein MurJ [Desulfobulbaceae bacterium]